MTTKPIFHGFSIYHSGSEGRGAKRPFLSSANGLNYVYLKAFPDFKRDWTHLRFNLTEAKVLLVQSRATKGDYASFLWELRLAQFMWHCAGDWGCPGTTWGVHRLAHSAGQKCPFGFYSVRGKETLQWGIFEMWKKHNHYRKLIRLPCWGR